MSDPDPRYVVTFNADADSTEGLRAMSLGDAERLVDFARPQLTGRILPADTRDEWDRAYPDSPIPPAWFDPDACGERWDEDE